MPRVTVITAAYNCSHTLRCAIQSILDQTFSDFEVWVVGDCCTDDSAEVVAGFGDKRLHWTNLSTRSGSQFGPNNEGLRRAEGEYVAYLGQDDLWFPWHLESLVATLDGGGVDFAHGLLAEFKAPDRISLGGAPQGVRSYGQRFVPPSGWMHRRDVVVRCGEWPHPGGLVAGVDFVFQRRAFLVGCRFASTGRLSVMKFHSAIFKIYARGEGYPQPGYLERMRQDSGALHDQVVMQLLVDSAHAIEELMTRPTAGGVFRAVVLRIADWYGIDRWPVSRYFKWRNASWRRRLPALRGLSRPLRNG
ncbi:MAG TPA: glycosyltransferase family A protein [Terracidiphilus sp.]